MSCISAVRNISSMSWLTQLAVLAAASVVAAEFGDVEVALLLTANAESNAVNRVTPGFGYRGTAFRAVGQRRPLRQLALNAFDRVLYRGIDLILHCTVTRPAGRHVSFLPKVPHR